MEQAAFTKKDTVHHILKQASITGTSIEFSQNPEYAKVIGATVFNKTVLAGKLEEIFQSEFLPNLVSKDYHFLVDEINKISKDRKNKTGRALGIIESVVEIIKKAREIIAEKKEGVDSIPEIASVTANDFKNEIYSLKSKISELEADKATLLESNKALDSENKSYYSQIEDLIAKNNELIAAAKSSEESK